MGWLTGSDREAEIWGLRFGSVLAQQINWVVWSIIPLVWSALSVLCGCSFGTGCWFLYKHVPLFQASCTKQKEQRDASFLQINKISSLLSSNWLSAREMIWLFSVYPLPFLRTCESASSMAAPSTAGIRNRSRGPWRRNLCWLMEKSWSLAATGNPSLTYTKAVHARPVHINFLPGVILFPCEVLCFWSLCPHSIITCSFRLPRLGTWFGLPPLLEAESPCFNKLHDR